MSMTLTDARASFDTFSRFAGSSSTIFATADRDRAILSALDDFVHKTKITKQTSTVAITSGSATVSFTGVTGFNPSRALRYYIAGKGSLSAVDYWTIDDKLACDTSMGVPCEIGFKDWTSAQVYKTPAADYTLSVLWVPAITFTVGEASPNSVTFGIPDDWLRQVLEYGAAAKLMAMLPETATMAAGKWQQYVAWRDSVAGAGSLGPRSVLRNV